MLPSRYLLLFSFGHTGSALLDMGFLQLQCAGCSLRCVLQLRCAGCSLHCFLQLAVCGLLIAVLSLVAVRGLLIAVLSLAVEHKLQGTRASVVAARGLSSCGARAYLLSGLWNLRRPGIKPMSPARAGGLLTSWTTRKVPQQVLLILVYQREAEQCSLDCIGFTLFSFIYLFGHVACGILVSLPGIEPMTPTLEAWSFHHSTAREVPSFAFLEGRFHPLLHSKLAP